MTRYGTLEAKYVDCRRDRTPLKWQGSVSHWLPTRAITTEVVEEAHKKLPYIFDGGCFGNERTNPDFEHIHGFWRDHTFERWELSSSNIESIIFDAEWLMHNVPFTPLPKIPRSRYWLSRNLFQPNTYGLKHVIEHATGHYSSNGEHIIAAEVAGLPWHPHIPNPQVGIRPAIYTMLRDRALRAREERDRALRAREERKHATTTKTTSEEK